MPEYKDKDGRWRWRYTHRGRQYSGSTPKGSNTAKVARTLEKEHFERIQARRYVGVMPRMSELVEQFLEYQKAHTAQLTYELQESNLRVHVIPHIGKRHADEVGAKDMDDLIGLWKRGGAAVRTINTRLGTVARVFTLAVEWGILQTAPRVKRLKVPDDIVRFLTQDEAQLLIAAARKRRGDRVYRWSSMIIIALRTGLRIGELRALIWGEVDIDTAGREVVFVRRSDPGRPGLAAGPTKGKRARMVPLTPHAVECLRAERAARREPPTAGDRVWPGIFDRTRARSESSCVHAMECIFEKAGIEERDGDRLGWHTLRHTYASWLAMAGVSLRVIQELLGHNSIRQTEVYAHLLPNAMHHSAVATLDAEIVQQLDAKIVDKLDAGAPIGELGPGDVDDDDEE